MKSDKEPEDVLIREALAPTKALKKKPQTVRAVDS